MTRRWLLVIALFVVCLAATSYATSTGTWSWPSAIAGLTAFAAQYAAEDRP